MEDIERQNSGRGKEEYTELVIEHQIPERTQLADLICTRLVNTTLKDVVKRWIQAVGLMLALYSRREVPR